MKREIKFRAWDNVENKMNTNGSIGAGSGSQNIDIGFDGIMSFYNSFGLMDGTNPAFDKPVNERFELMQFTGVKDKNGKEIYEGDIVIAWSAGSKGKFEIKWRQDGAPMWLLYPAWQAGAFWNISATHHTKGKQFIDVSGKIESTNLEGYFDDGIEVIGNIYENPELLPNEKK